MNIIIALFTDSPMLNGKYLQMHKEQIDGVTKSKFLYGFAPVMAIIHSLELLCYLLIQMHKPYSNLHLFELAYISAPQQRINSNKHKVN